MQMIDGMPREQFWCAAPDLSRACHSEDRSSCLTPALFSALFSSNNNILLMFMNDEYLHEYFKYLEYLGHDNDAFYANNNNNKKKTILDFKMPQWKITDLIKEVVYFR